MKSPLFFFFLTEQNVNKCKWILWSLSLYGRWGCWRKSGEDNVEFGWNICILDPASLLITWIFAAWAVSSFWFAFFFSHPLKVTFDSCVRQISSPCCLFQARMVGWQRECSQMPQQASSGRGEEVLSPSPGQCSKPTNRSQEGVTEAGVKARWPESNPRFIKKCPSGLNISWPEGWSQGLFGI